MEQRMERATIRGIATPVSRLIIGADNQVDIESTAIFDDWFDVGGNAFDTGWWYFDGECQRMLGQWITRNGVRDEVVVIDKVAHTPACTPAAVTEQLHESLERLGHDHIDLLLLHRDNLEVPVAEFVDVLAEHQRAGLIGAYGASNWTTARIDVANGYAASAGAAPFVALSNNLALARMVDVPWPGCETMDDDDRRWAADHQMAILPWSSQGRGFFTERAAPEKVTNAELVSTWYSNSNFERKARAAKLAAERGVEEINIALAWVLAQPYPTFPLIGPRNSAELASSLVALSVDLTSDELAWLDLRTDTA